MRMLHSKKSPPLGTTSKKHQNKHFMKSLAFSKSNNKDPYYVKSKPMGQNKCRDTCPKCHKDLRFYRKFIHKAETVEIIRKFNIKRSYVIISPFEKMLCKKEEEAQLTTKVCQIKEVEKAKRQQEFLEKYFFKYGVSNSDILSYCVQEKSTIEALICDVSSEFSELQEYGIHPDNITKIYFQKEKNVSRFLTSLRQFNSVCSEMEMKKLQDSSEKSKTRAKDAPELKNLIIPLLRLENMDLPSSLKISLPVSKKDKTYPILTDLRNKIKKKQKSLAFSKSKNKDPYYVKSNSSKSFEHKKILEGNVCEVEDNSTYITQLSETVKQNYYEAFLEDDDDDDEIQCASTRTLIVLVERLEDHDIRRLSISNKEESSVVKKKLQGKPESLTEPAKLLQKRRKTDASENAELEVFQISEGISTDSEYILDQKKEKLTNEKVEFQREKAKSKDDIQTQERVSLVIEDTPKRMRIRSMEKHGKENFENVNANENAESEALQILKGTSAVEEKKYIYDFEPLSLSQKEINKDEKLTNEKALGIHDNKCQIRDNTETLEKVNKYSGERMRTESMERQGKEILEEENVEVFEISEGTFAIHEVISEEEKDISKSEPHTLNKALEEKGKDEELTSSKVVEIFEDDVRDAQIEKNVTEVHVSLNRYTGRRMRTLSMEKQGKDILKDENAGSEVFQIATDLERILKPKKDICVAESLSQSQKEMDDSKNYFKELPSEITNDMDVEEMVKGHDDLSMIIGESDIVVDMEIFDIEDLSDTEVKSVDFQMSASMDDSSTLNGSEVIQGAGAVKEHEQDYRTLTKSQSKEEITVTEDRKKSLLEIGDLNINNPYCRLYYSLQDAGNKSLARNDESLDKKKILDNFYAALLEQTGLDKPTSLQPVKRVSPFNHSGGH